MMNLQSFQEFSLYITEALTKEDLFKLYIVKRYDTHDNYFITPDIVFKDVIDRNRIQFLYIKEVRKYLDINGKHCYSKVIFTSLNDQLANSGYSIANYVQLALAGVGYAFPMLKLVEPEAVPYNQRLNFVDNPNLIMNRKRPIAKRFQSSPKEELYIAVVLDEERIIDIGV